MNLALITATLFGVAVATIEPPRVLLTGSNFTEELSVDDQDSWPNNFTDVVLQVPHRQSRSEGQQKIDKVRTLPYEVRQRLFNLGQQRQGQVQQLDVRQATFPASSCVKLKTFYNNWWLQRFNNNHETAKQAIRDIVAAANGFYGRPGLSTRITISLAEEPVHISSSNANWNVGGDNVDWLRHPTVTDTIRGDAERATIQHYSFFTVSPFSDNVVGIAFRGTVCIQATRDLDFKASITEYHVSISYTGETFAHELGHALGMGHDFTSFNCNGNQCTKTNRFGSNGQVCTNVGGIMDYVQSPNRWTQCSEDDLQRYMSDAGGFCLPQQCTDNGGGGNPTNPPTNPTNPPNPSNPPNPTTTTPATTTTRRPAPAPCRNACNRRTCRPRRYCRWLRRQWGGCSSKYGLAYCRRTCQRCNTCRDMNPLCAPIHCSNYVNRIGICPATCGTC